MQLALLLFAILLAIIYFFVYHTIQKKYNDFALQNSIYLRRLQEINRKYVFFKHINFDQSHTYDNEFFFCEISCLDYLTYQLQFIHAEVIDQINNASQNNRLYAEYLTEIYSLGSPGNFLIEIGNLKYEKLLAAEKQLIEKHTYPIPIIDFNIIVTLHCSQINGRIYAKKNEVFCADDILGLIKRLKNRNGTFYRDREIWNSICRVERGKVSNKLRFSIYQRDGYRCCKCGISQAYAQLEIDHIVPISKGGKSVYSNLQTLCHKCNVEKGNKVDF